MECYDLIRRNTPFLLIYSNSPTLLDKEKMQSALYAQDDDIKEGSLKEGKQCNTLIGFSHCLKYE